MKFIIPAILLILSGCSSNTEEIAAEPEIYSLLGDEFFAPSEVNPKLDSNLAVARKNFDANQSEENYIWLGRRTAYLTRYNEAIDIFSEGIDKFPVSYRLYRHRGHRCCRQRHR